MPGDYAAFGKTVRARRDPSLTSESMRKKRRRETIKKSGDRHLIDGLECSKGRSRNTCGRLSNYGSVPFGKQKCPLPGRVRHKEIYSPIIETLADRNLFVPGLESQLGAQRRCHSRILKELK